MKQSEKDKALDQEQIEKILACIQQDILEQSQLAKQAGKPNDFATGYVAALYMLSHRQLNTMPGEMLRLLEGENSIIPHYGGSWNLQIALYAVGCKLYGQEPDPSIEQLYSYLNEFIEKMAEKEVLERLISIIKH